MFPDTVEGQDSAGVRDLEHRKSAALASDLGCQPQPAPRQLGQRRTHGEVSLPRDRPGRLQDLVVDVQGRSHGKGTACRCDDVKMH